MSALPQSQSSPLFVRWKAKVADTAGSRNFFVSFVSVLLLMLEMNGLGTGADPGNIVDAITSADLGRILSILLLNFLNPIMKIIQKQVEWSWDFLRSPNFWTQVATTLLIGITMFGIAFPDGAAADLVDAIFGGEFQVIAIALIINVLNPLWHFFFDKKTPPTNRETLDGEHSSPLLRV